MNTFDYPEPDLNPREPNVQLDLDYYEELIDDFDIVTIEE